MPDRDDVDEPLPYRNSADDREPFDVIAFLVGGVVGVVMVGFVGVNFLVIHTARATTRPGGHLPPTFGFVAVAVPTLFGAWVMSRRSGGRRAQLLGWLLGVGVTCLVEGACFAGQG